MSYFCLQFKINLEFNMQNINKIEIMSPAGSFESLIAAVQGGADSVYFGAGYLNMRSKSSANFSLDDLRQITDICRVYNIKSYLTLNTIIYEEDIQPMDQMLELAKDTNASAVIASDMAVIQKASALGLNIHASTQLNISNSSAVEYFSKYCNVMVLARELTLDQVKKITEHIDRHNICGPNGEKVKIEIFAHGALCMAVSGKCYLSLHQFNKSANRGECAQVCRRGYEVKDKASGYSLEIDNEFIMSPQDLCTIGFLDKIIDAGVGVLKIEGRGRSPEYVKRTAECYKKASEAVFNGNYNTELIEDLTQKLGEVFNRGFWDGYYLGEKLGKWSERHGSKAAKTKVFVGIAKKHYPKIDIGEFLIQTESLSVGDEYLITGTTTGVVEGVVASLHKDEGAVETAQKGDVIAFPVPVKVRSRDKLYKLVDSDSLKS